MNKYQEALDRIETAPGFMGGTKEYRYSTQSSTPFLEDMAVLQELVDKETPKELVGIYDDTVYSSNQTTRLKIYKCPVCGNKNIIPDDKYCRECGNRVFRKSEWSEEDDS